MWRNLRSLIPVLTIACLQPAFAQVSYSLEHREWEVTGFAGRSFVTKSRFSTPVTGSDQESSRTVGIEYASGYETGVRVSQNVNDFWAADLEYSFANQPLTFTNLSPGIESLSLTQYIHDFSYNVSYLPLPRTKRFRPYVLAGVGAALFYIAGRSKKDALELGVWLRDSWEFTFNWGGGFKYLIQDQFALTFDVKDRISRVPSYGLPASTVVAGGQYQPGIAVHGPLQNWQLNFGFTFQWDE